MKIKAIFKIIFAKEYLVATDKTALLMGSDKAIKQAQILIKYLGPTKFAVQYRLTNTARKSEVSSEN